MFDELVTRLQAARGSPLRRRCCSDRSRNDGWDATFAGEGQRAETKRPRTGLHLAVAPNYFSTLRVSIIVAARSMNPIAKVRFRRHLGERLRGVRGRTHRL
jgi:hypothetical protein